MNNILPAVVIALLAGATGPVAAASQAALADTRWQLVEFQSMDDAQGTTRPGNPALYTMQLGGDGSVTMQLNCNRAKGTWSTEPGNDATSGRFRFGALATTRMLCPPPSMDETVSTQAEHVTGYLLKDGRLYLSLMADAGILVWAADSGPSVTGTTPVAAEDGGPRDWEVMDRLRLREQPSLSAPTITTFAPGTILDNLGCRQAGERIWCEVQPLGGGPRGFVAAEFLKPAPSADGSVASGVDDSALRAGQGIFDATGKLPCAQHAGQPMGQCDFGVARAGGGYATVVINKPDGRSRAIFFRMGRPIGTDVSEAEGYHQFRATRESDLHLIRIGNERYEIPVAVILGG